MSMHRIIRFYGVFCQTDPIAAQASLLTKLPSSAVRAAEKVV